MKRTFTQTLNNLINKSPDGGVVPTRTTPPHVQVREAPPMVVQRVSKIATAMNSLKEEALVLDKNTDELEAGIRFACMPAPPDDEIATVPSSGVQLADGIVDVIQILARINRRVASLNKRLEL